MDQRSRCVSTNNRGTTAAQRGTLPPSHRGDANLLAALSVCAVCVRCRLRFIIPPCYL